MRPLPFRGRGERGVNERVKGGKNYTCFDVSHEKGDASLSDPPPSAAVDQWQRIMLHFYCDFVSSLPEATKVDSRSGAKTER